MPVNHGPDSHRGWFEPSRWLSGEERKEMATCLIQQRRYAIRFFNVVFLVRALPMAIGRGAEKKWLFD